MAVRFYQFIYPLLSVWIIAAYIHLLHLVYIFQFVKSRLLIYLLFIPVMILEFYFSLHFPWGSAMALADIDRGWIVLYIFKTAYWFGFFMIWVIFMSFVSKQAVVIKFFITKFYSQFYLLFRAEGWITAVALGAWLLLYYFLTVRGGMLRITTAMVIPILLSFGLLYHLYHYGGLGGLRKGRVRGQSGVEKVFRYEEIGSYTVPRHPRGIRYDATEKALFVMFGATYARNRSYPTIIRTDLNTGRDHAFVSRNIRRIAFDNQSHCVFVAPWYENFIFKLSKRDLTVINRFPNQVEKLLQTWEPMDVLKDISENRIYVGNDAEQALIAYDSESGRLVKILNLLEKGYVKVGGPVWNILQSPSTRKLYLTTGPGTHLFEVDPDTLTVTKKRKFPDVVGTALDIDDEGGLLYYQNGGLNSLYAVDIETFAIKRKYKGELHARRIRLDKKRNCIYVLGYLSGMIFPVDLGTGKQPWKRYVGGLPHGMDLNGDILWVNSMAGVLKLDLRNIWGE